MAPRLRLALMAFASLVLLAALGVVLLVNHSSKSNASGFEGSVRPPIPQQTWTLRDQDGRSVRLGAPASGPAIVTFLYTHCRDTCPVTAQQIMGGLDQLGHDVPAYAVSVDPAHDTPQSAQAFLARQHLTGRMRFLLQPPADLQRVWKEFGIQPQERGLEHTAYVVLLDAAGRQRVGFPADKLSPEALAHDLRLLQPAA